MVAGAPTHCTKPAWAAGCRRKSCVRRHSFGQDDAGCGRIAHVGIAQAVGDRVAGQHAPRDAVIFPQLQICAARHGDGHRLRSTRDAIGYQRHREGVYACCHARRRRDLHLKGQVSRERNGKIRTGRHLHPVGKPGGRQQFHHIRAPGQLHTAADRGLQAVVSGGQIAASALRPNLPHILKKWIELHGKQIGVLPVHLVKGGLPIEVIVAHADIGRIAGFVHHAVAPGVAAGAECAHCPWHILVQVVVMGHVIAKHDDLSFRICAIAQRTVGRICLPHQFGDALIEHAGIAGRWIAASVGGNACKRRQHLGLGDCERLVKTIGKARGRVIRNRGAVGVLIAKGIIRCRIVAVRNDGEAHIQPIAGERLDRVGCHGFDAGQELPHAFCAVKGKNHVCRAKFGGQECRLALGDRLSGRQGRAELSGRQRWRGDDGLGDAHTHSSGKRLSAFAQQRLLLFALRAAIDCHNVIRARDFAWGKRRLRQASGVGGGHKRLVGGHKLHQMARQRCGVRRVAHSRLQEERLAGARLLCAQIAQDDGQLRRALAARFAHGGCAQQEQQRRRQ